MLLAITQFNTCLNIFAMAKVSLNIFAMAMVSEKQMN